MTKARVYNSEIIKELMAETSPEELARTEKRMLLAARLDDAIKARGWRQTEFAKAIGKKPSEVSKWLSGTHNFTVDTLFDIEGVLKINLVRLENKQETIVRTYNITVSSVSAGVPIGDWFKTLISKSSHSVYKANSHINSLN